MSQPTESNPAPEMTTVQLSRIIVSANPRRYFSREKHHELVASLRLRGMLQPILLRPGTVPNTYTVVAGERRYRAALEAFGSDGMIPAVVREMSDQEALEASIDENDVREDASETEQADAAVRVLAACQNDRAEAAKRLGWSPAKLDRRLALAALSDAVKSALDERRIKVGHAELLAAVPADKQDKALETILSAGIDVAKTRELLMRMTQSLAAATFDKTECANCGYNSARQCALFETHVDDGHCTNGACFALKVEAHERARTDTEAAAAPAHAAETPAEAVAQCRVCGCTENRACAEPCAWTDETKTLCDNPECVAKAAGGPTDNHVAESVNSKPKSVNPPASPAPAPAAPKVTAQSLATKLAMTRDRAWRGAVAAAIADSADHIRVADLAAEYVKGGVPISFGRLTLLAAEFEVDLRDHWRVDKALLEPMTKDELKFVAQECGLVEHMGTKPFAKLLAAKPADMVAGMLNATGFDWAGRLPSAMTLDGKYGAPIAITTDKD